MKDIEWNPIQLSTAAINLPSHDTVNTTVFTLSSLENAVQLQFGAGGSTLRYSHGIVTPQSVSLSIQTSLPQNFGPSQVTLVTYVCRSAQKQNYRYSPFPETNANRTINRHPNVTPLTPTSPQ